jgi:chromosomal replication initiation ATPase DnaA
MSNKNKFFAELKKHENLDKFHLKSKKINLSVVDDIQSKLNSFEMAESEASYLAYDWGDQIIDAFSDLQQQYNIDDYIVNGNTKFLDEAAEGISEDLDKIEQAANEIGISPNDIYYDYDNLRDRVIAAGDIYNDAFDKYIEVINYIGNNSFWNR